MKFQLRTLFIGLAFIALVLAWLGVLRQNQELQNRIHMVRQEMKTERSRTRELAKIDPPRKGARKFNAVKFDGMDLSGVKISGGSFQRASFLHTDLTDATLSGGASSFQSANFTSAQLSGATLTGGGASFQFASFEGATLIDAMLAGNFQAATFRDADLSQCVIKVDSIVGFQGVNLNATRFEGADLSSIHGPTLSQCYFETPPTYDEDTVFPEGFDPKADGWKKSN